MSTNSINSNNVNESDIDSEAMDVDKLGITEEEGEHQSEMSDFAGPMALPVCTHFIILSDVNAIANECISVDLASILKILSRNNTNFGNEIDELQEFAKNYSFNLYICILNQNEKKFYYLNATSVEGNQQWPRAYLVFDKHSRSFYPFYKRINNNKYSTIFPVKDTHTLQLFEDSVDSYNWPNDSAIMQQLPDQDMSEIDEQNNEEENASITDVNYHTVDTDTSSKNVDVLSRRFKPNDTIEDNTRETSVNVNERVISRVRAPNDEETSTVTDVSIVTKSSLSLNSRSTTISNTYMLSKPKLSNQPARLRRNRTLGDLRNDKVCPAVQVEGAGQGTLLQFMLPKEINDHQKTLYLGAHAATYDKEKHDRNLLMPINISVKAGANLKTNDVSNLIVPNNEKNSDKFDPETKGVFSKIIPDELESLHKEWTFKMVNLYQDNIITKELIQTKKLRWCRLMFAIYIKLPDGQFKRVSPRTFSDLIEETYGAQSVNTDSVVPGRFCQKGGQMVYIPLGQSAKKSDVLVYCNGKVLNELDYQINKTILSFETPECKQARNDLNIIICNQKTNGRVPVKKQYHPHDDHLEPCGVMNKD